MTENEELRDALNKASYALFDVKRMGVSDQVHDYCSKASSASAAVLDGEESIEAINEMWPESVRRIFSKDNQ